MIKPLDYFSHRLAAPFLAISARFSGVALSPEPPHLISQAGLPGSLASGPVCTMVETHKTKTRNSYWKKSENWIGLLTMILVAFYTGIQLGQTILIRGNNVATLQAFVCASSPGAIPAFDEVDNSRKLVVIIVPFTNSGSTPTRNVNMTVRYATPIEALNDPWPLIRDQTVTHVPSVIAPHTSNTFACTFTADKW